MDDLGGCLVVDTRMVVVEQMVRVGPGDPVGGGAHGADEVFVVKFVVSFFLRKITMFLTICPSPVLKLCVMSLT